MEGLFGEPKQEVLFQDKKKKDYKKVLKTILVILLILGILSGSAYGVFYYLTEIRNRSARTDMLELAKNIDFNKFTDIQGLSEYFENINNNSYEFNAQTEVNNAQLTNMIKDMTKNEDLNIKDFKVIFNGKVDRNANKLQTKINLKHKENDVVDFEVQDTEKQIMIYGKDFFQEFIGFDKDKLKTFLVKEYKLNNETASKIDDLTKVSLKTNYIKEVEVIFNSIIKSLPQALEILTEENYELNRNVKVNYRNNSLNATRHSLKLTNPQYTSLIERITSLSKTDANTQSIEVQSLVGKTDKMVDSFLGYFKQIIRLRSNENLNINIYSIKNNIAKIEFVKVKDGEEDKTVFEIELISEKNSNELLIQNEELKLRIVVTKDNSKIYTKIDIDGKIPIPEALDIDNKPIKEIDDNKKENNTSRLTTGKKNEFSTQIDLPETEQTRNEQETTQEINNEDNKNQETGIPVVDFVEDKDLEKIEEEIFTNKVELKANISYDRPINNSSNMNFNIIFNSSDIEIIMKIDIGIKESVLIENPMKIISLTGMKSDQLKRNMKVINETILKIFINKLSKLGLIK